MALAALRPRGVLLLPLLGLLLLGLGCPKKTDTPKTDGPDSTETESETPAGDGTLAVLDGKPIMKVDLFKTPELRGVLIAMRNEAIERALTEAEYKKSGLTLSDEELAAVRSRFLKFNGVTDRDGKSAEEVFATEILPAQGLSPEVFNEVFLQQQYATQLILKDHPITDADLQALFDNPETFPKDQVVGQWGPIYGWTAPTDLTVENTKDLLTEMVTQERIGEYQGELTDRLATAARESNSLDIRRLPSEALPEEVSPAVDGMPTQTPAAAGDWTPDPVSFVLAGTEVTWESVLQNHSGPKRVERMYRTLVESAVVDYLFAKGNLTLSPNEVAEQRSQLVEQAGGEDAFKEGLAVNSTTEAEMATAFERVARSRQLLLVAYPVSDDEVKSTYDSATPADWLERVGASLGITKPEEASFEKVGPEIRKGLENSRGANRMSWLYERQQELINQEILKIVDEAVTPEAPEAPPQMGGMPPGGMPPGAVPQGGPAPIVVPPTG